jgi:hypothetical protein
MENARSQDKILGSVSSLAFCLCLLGEFTELHTAAEGAEKYLVLPGIRAFAREDLAVSGEEAQGHHSD